jgi:hypothetical protein
METPIYSGHRRQLRPRRGGKERGPWRPPDSQDPEREREPWRTPPGGAPRTARTQREEKGAMETSLSWAPQAAKTQEGQEGKGAMETPDTQQPERKRRKRGPWRPPPARHPGTRERREGEGVLETPGHPGPRERERRERGLWRNPPHHLGAPQTGRTQGEAGGRGGHGDLWPPRIHREAGRGHGDPSSPMWDNQVEFGGIPSKKHTQAPLQQFAGVPATHTPLPQVPTRLRPGILSFPIEREVFYAANA